MTSVAIASTSTSTSGSNKRKVQVLSSLVGDKDEAEGDITRTATTSAEAEKKIKSSLVEFGFRHIDQVSVIKGTSAAVINDGKRQNPQGDILDITIQVVGRLLSSADHQDQDRLQMDKEYQNAHLSSMFQVKLITTVPEVIALCKQSGLGNYLHHVTWKSSPKDGVRHGHDWRLAEWKAEHKYDDPEKSEECKSLILQQFYLTKPLTRSEWSNWESLVGYSSDHDDLTNWMKFIGHTHVGGWLSFAFEVFHAFGNYMDHEMKKPLTKDQKLSILFYLISISTSSDAIMLNMYSPIIESVLSIRHFASQTLQDNAWIKWKSSIRN